MIKQNNTVSKPNLWFHLRILLQNNIMRDVHKTANLMTSNNLLEKLTITTDIIANLF
jgi:hypothetical protein